MKDQVIQKILNANRLSKETPGRRPEQDIELVTQDVDKPLTDETQESISKTDNRTLEDFKGRCSITTEVDEDVQEAEHEEKGGRNLGSVKPRRVDEEDNDKGGKKGGAEVQATNRDETEVENLPSDTADDSLPPPKTLNADQSSDTDMEVDATDGVTGDSVQSCSVECPMTPTLAPTPRQYHGFDFEQSARKGSTVSEHN
ncbi:unnamed protein product [Coregonus sp. 'balchen']|nr:unnamed protein product [Coregonus sp. 'balchen']